MKGKELNSKQVRVSNTGVKGIIVIGMNRSGTKWLTNEIAKFSNIISVQSEKTGIRESNILQAIPKKFNTKYVDEYIGAIELWSTTEFFRKTDVDKTIFYKENYRNKDWLFHFNILMASYAKKNNKSYWVQKFSPEKVLDYDLSEHHVVCIKRDVVDQIRSNLSRYKSKPTFSDLVRAVLSYLRQEKYIDALAQRYNAEVIDYKNFKLNKVEILEQVFQDIRESIGGYDESINFKKNSSFSTKKRFSYLKKRQKKEILFLYRLLKYLPHSLLIWITAKRTNKYQLVAGTFQDIRLQYPHLLDENL